MKKIIATLEANGMPMFWFIFLICTLILSITAEVVGLMTMWGWIWK